MAEITCTAPGTIVDRNNCYYKWPKYPCYSKKHRSCFSPGGVMNEDPLFHVYDGIAKAYIWGFNVASESLAERKFAPDPEAEQKLRESFVTQGPWPPLVPIPRIHQPLPELETNIGLVNAAENPGLRYLQENPVLGRLYAEPMGTLRGLAQTVYNNTVGRCTRRRRDGAPPDLVRHPSGERAMRKKCNRRNPRKRGNSPKRRNTRKCRNTRKRRNTRKCRDTCKRRNTRKRRKT